MNHHIYVVDQYPLLCLAALMFIGIFAAFFLHVKLHKVGNRFQLGIAVCLANDEKICYGFRNFTKVEADNVLSFFFRE